MFFNVQQNHSTVNGGYITENINNYKNGLQSRLSFKHFGWLVHVAESECPGREYESTLAPSVNSRRALITFSFKFECSGSSSRQNGYTEKSFIRWPKGTKISDFIFSAYRKIKSEIFPKISDFIFSTYKKNKVWNFTKNYRLYFFNSINKRINYSIHVNI